MQSARALGSTFHLACVSGPDLGAVLAAGPGAILGRSVGLEDPFTDHVQLELAVQRGRVVARDVASTNRVGVLRRTFPLAVGRTIRVGGNKWVLRKRASTSAWENAKAPKKSQQAGRILRFVMPLVILASLSRLFLPAGLLPLLLVPLVLLGGGSWWWDRRKGRLRSDPASLLLEVAARVLSEAPSPGVDNGSGPEAGLEAVHEAVPYYVEPAGKQVSGLDPDGFAVVGARARAGALWGGAQVFLATGRLPTLSWAKSVEHLRSPAAQVVQAGRTPGALWELEMGELLLAGGREKELPNSLALTDLLGAPSPELIQARWQVAGADPEKLWAVPLGLKAGAEPFAFDLVAGGPHALVVGGTGSGKSEFLTSLVVGLAASKPPSDLRFVFIDYKGGAGLAHLESLPHVELSLTDLEGTQTPWLLRALKAEVRNRKEALRKAGFRDLETWQAAGANPLGKGALPAIVVVADEVALLAQTSPGLLDQLGQIGAQGRSLGLHLVLASQRAGGVITANLKAVLDLRVALRCSEERDSIDVVGDPSAARLPRLPGRAIVQSEGKRAEIQGAYTEDAPSWVTAIKDACTGEHARRGNFFPRPLPASYNPTVYGRGSSSPGSSVGLYEDPETAGLAPLVWDGKPLSLVGPDQDQLQALARGLVEGTRGPVIWAGPTSGNSPHLGDTLFLLEETLEECREPTQKSEEIPTIVIPGFGPLLEQTGAAAGVAASGELLRTLTDLGSRKALRLITTDTSPGAATRAFPWRVLHLPSPDLLTRADYLSLLPAAGGAQERIAWVSELPGRVVVFGPGLSGVRAQLALPKRQSVVAQGGHFHSPTSCRGFESPGPESSQVRSLTVVSEHPGDLALVQALHGRGSAFETLRHLLPSQWVQIPQAAVDAVISIEPNRETVRMITSPLRRAPIWPLASLPFAERVGIARFGQKLTRVLLPEKVPDSPVCDRSHSKS